MKAKLFEVDEESGKKIMFPWYGPDGLPNGDWYVFLYDEDNPPNFLKNEDLHDSKVLVPKVYGHAVIAEVPTYGNDGGLSGGSVLIAQPLIDTVEFAQALVAATQKFVERKK